MVLDVEKLISGGDALARIEGKPVFIPGALPGERVEIEITLEKPGFFRGRLVTIITPSSHRRQPPCPLVGTCGGCTWQHLTEEYQRAQKALLTQEAFRRLGAMEIPLPQVFSGPSWNYRNRIQVHRNSQGLLGFKALASDTIVPVVHCPIALEPLNNFLKTAQDGGSNGPSLKDRFQVFSDGESLWAEGQTKEATVTILNKQIHFALEGFFQSNLALLPALLTQVIQWAGEGESALDLYGGVGLFGTFLQDHFNSVTVVEENTFALAMARKNIPGGKFFSGSVEDWLKQRPSSPDLVVVDPPRTGLSSTVRNALIKLKAPKIIYVSCNPDTMARDSKELKAGGYELSNLQVYDFYPQTPHIEALGLWVQGK